MSKSLVTADPSHITDHPFTPRGEWWTTCGHRDPAGQLVQGRVVTAKRCGLGEAAHSASVLAHPKDSTAGTPRAAAA